MSVTRLICEGCGFLQMHCNCKLSMTDHPKPIAPEEIYLQFHGDSSEDGPVDLSDVTWSAERVYARDVRYVHESVLTAKDARIAELEEGREGYEAGCRDIAQDALDELTRLRTAIEAKAKEGDARDPTGRFATISSASLRALLEKKP